MASGLPVVSTRSVGVVDCLRDGDNGLLVDPGDVPALAGALARVLDDHPLRARLAARALDEVRAAYAWPAIARQIEGEYARVRAEPPSAAWSADGLFDGPGDPCRFRAAPHLL
jgi:glycosyltransferase involved in cell wall biosynthesis